MMVVLKRKTLDVVVYDGEIGNNMLKGKECVDRM